jgi:hypothetical protein
VNANHPDDDTLGYDGVVHDRDEAMTNRKGVGVVDAILLRQRAGRSRYASLKSRTVADFRASQR